MADYKTIPTSLEVWAVIRAAHPEMVVFGSYSYPEGNPHGNMDMGEMFTSYGFPGGDYPVIEARTTWGIIRNEGCLFHKRENEKHEYWLCLPIKEEE